MSGDVCDFNIKLRAVIKFFFLQGKALKEIHTILKESLRETCTLICHHQKLGGPV
jgi:hypothetical protein